MPTVSAWVKAIAAVHKVNPTFYYATVAHNNSSIYPHTPHSVHMHMQTVAVFSESIRI